jgi:hypothetical protein
MDAIYVTLDRTAGAIGQQCLYNRLRSWTSSASLPAFEALVTRTTNDVGVRERCQMALARLHSPAGYHLWRLSEDGALRIPRWNGVIAPALAAAMLVTMASGLWWPAAFGGLVALLPVCLVVRVLTGRQVAAVIDAFRLVGPLVSAAEVARQLVDKDTDQLTRPLVEEAPRLTRLRFVSTWLTRDSSAMDPISMILFELANYLLALDSNALVFVAMTCPL